MAPPSALRLPPFFADGMVLQRDKPIRVFGWADAGAVVHVRLGDREKRAKCGRSGRWTALLPALPAGGPHDLSIRSADQAVSFRDILIGDVWFCSGQSNMDFRVEKSLNAKAEIKKARLPFIRHFQTERAAAEKPQDNVTGAWQICTPATVGRFSAVAFYFAREIHDRTGVPIGIIHSSWGGSPIEAWIPPRAYVTSPALKPLLRMQRVLRRPGKPLREMFLRWEREQVTPDPGNQGEGWGWAGKDFPDQKWDTMQVPGFWEGRGLFIDGAVWFRRSVKIPTDWQGHDLCLELGPIDDFDQTYFNGTKIGETGKSVENAHKVPRAYRVPASCIGSGSAKIAVRIFDQFGSGGFVATKEAMRLTCPALPQPPAIPLAGKWRYRVEWSVDRPAPVPQPPALPEPRAQLAQLYNGMVHAFAGLPIRGFLWYQGESNAFRAAHYAQSFPLLIQAWREAWNDARLPFYFVQLANYRSRPAKPGEDAWAELREAQALTLKKQKNTAMAVAIDVGEAEDIHPPNKSAVGRRLALLALTRDYGMALEESGPVLVGAIFGKKKVRLTFSRVGEGLRTSDGGNVCGFALSAKDRRWHWADVRIMGRTGVELSCAQVAVPTAVRYGWASNPGSNLENSHGLPAAPFRTDRWPRLTEGNLWPF